MLKPWPLVRSEPGPSYRVFSLRTDTARSPRTGEEYNFFLMQSPDWVSVIPITGSGEVLLVRQYRHGSRSFSLETPGGLVDEGEDPQEAARRELLEETGCQAESLRLLGSFSPQPAVFTNRLHVYLATGVRQVSDLRQDAGEDLEVLAVPRDEIPRLIRQGEIQHGLVIAGFYLLENDALFRRGAGRQVP